MRLPSSGVGLTVVPPVAEFPPDSRFSLRCFARYPNGQILDVTERVNWSLAEGFRLPGVALSDRPGEKGLITVEPLPTDPEEFRNFERRYADSGEVRAVDRGGERADSVLRFVSEVTWRGLTSISLVPGGQAA